jgi:peptidoglycan L-alanyl-D-glutamate endopeptidase CwlK
MAFQLGKRSKAELVGVHPDMVKVVKTALKNSLVDFGVFDGIRTAAEQNALYRRKASQIDGYRRIGKHQVQKDGKCHAVDLVPWINGGYEWDWEAIYEIAEAVRNAARHHGVPVLWGGCWGHTALNDLSAPTDKLVEMYVQRKMKAGKRAFNDGPHYQLHGY